MQSFFKTLILSVPMSITAIDEIGYIARVDGESMTPTLNPSRDSEYVFLNKFVRKYSLKRGEIISLISPKDPLQRIIKRVVAVEGDVIKTLGYKKDFLQVPPGMIWIEGDHTTNSLDSNTFGPVSLGLVTAKATHVVWPPARWKKLNSDPKRHPIKFAKNDPLKSNLRQKSQ